MLIRHIDLMGLDAETGVAVYSGKNSLSEIKISNDRSYIIEHDHLPYDFTMRGPDVKSISEMISPNAFFISGKKFKNYGVDAKRLESFITELIKLWNENDKLWWKAEDKDNDEYKDKEEVVSNAILKFRVYAADLKELQEKCLSMLEGDLKTIIEESIMQEIIE